MEKIIFSSLQQTRLTTLDLAGNRIKKIENIAHLEDLHEFWVRNIVLLLQSDFYQF